MSMNVNILMCVGLALIVALTMIVQGSTRKTDLISFRNFFLSGFILFQLSSATLTFVTGEWGDTPVAYPERTGFVFSCFALVFLTLFFIAYRRGWWVKRLAVRAQDDIPAPSPASMLTIAFTCMVIGLLFRTVLIYVYLLGKLTDPIGNGLLAIAAALAMWAWAPRLLNPLVAFFAVLIIIGSMLGVLQHSQGRRDLVGVLAAVAWGAYHAHWKHMGLKWSLLRLAPPTVAALVLLAAITSTRRSSEQRSVGKVFSDMAHADLANGFLQLASGQEAGPISMWLIETRPGEFAYDHLHMLRYTVCAPIPRDWWKGKPSAIGFDLVKQARIKNKAPEYNTGPGILGHVGNDNPFIALWMYPLLFGLLMRLLDEVVDRSPNNPFVILPMGTCIGEIIALARGETGLFLFRAITTIVIAWVAMRVVVWLLRTVLGYAVRYDESEADEHTPDPGTDAWPDSDQPAEPLVIR
ncbi:MAG: hypothetical protein JNM07_10240 [Phycisphaerae bacterium]|nr:hypothetical protein [Phycisphaerae bacterium]